MNYLIGIDIGTSGTKSILMDEDGCVIASATAEYPLYQPQNGWAEQDPEDWWLAVCKTLQQITKAVSLQQIVGIGLSGQMHSLVLLDEDDGINDALEVVDAFLDESTSKVCLHVNK